MIENYYAIILDLVELSNEYLHAKIGIGTAENEPHKVWKCFIVIQFICSVAS